MSNSDIDRAFMDLKALSQKKVICSLMIWRDALMAYR
jgi:hypothetical protein